jgi:uncharacterized protein YsxB (DUF464 family)
MSMIHITYKDGGDSFIIEAHGHAGYAEAGHDIVCSAVSVLLQTLIARLDDTTADYDEWYEAGQALVRGSGQLACESFRTVLTGLLSVSETYPQYVEVIRKG